MDNYHIHSTFCDGHDTIEAMADAACRAGLNRVGFTSHAPLIYPNDWTMPAERFSGYCETIRKVKARYAGQMDVYTGLEADYYPAPQAISEEVRSMIPKLDYWIGSVHCLGLFDDGEVGYADLDASHFARVVDEIYHGDSQAVVETYYRAVAEMALSEKPDIIGHIDIIKKNNEANRFFDPESDWYRDLWRQALIAVKAAGAIIELNTGGAARYGTRCLYPSIEMLKEAAAMGIPVTVTGDSHSARTIDFGYYDLVPEALGAAGVSSIVYFDGQSWRETGIC